MQNKFRYLPFMSGTYSTAPGLSILEKADDEQDKLVFQVDEKYDRYIDNKQACRKEDIQKYYLESDLSVGTIQLVNEFIANRLVLEKPDVYSLSVDRIFRNSLRNEEIQVDSDWASLKGSEYLSVFDALCNQVQEDMAVFQLKEEGDYLASIHLCSPNHWSPADKIGKPFDAIHKPVADMSETITRYPAMLKSIVERKGPFTRFAWGIGTDDRLNHHSIAPKGICQSDWEGRSIDADNQAIYLRVERQNLIGFPEANAFLFTIRTFFYEVNSLDFLEKQNLWEAVKTMTPASLKYKGIDRLLPVLEKRLTTI